MKKKYYFLLLLVLLIFPIQQVLADNTVSKIVKLTGSLIGTVEDEDFLLPESLTNLNKTITFMSVRHLGDSNAKEIYRSWDFVNNTAIRFHGSSNFPANNAPMDFVAYFVEFTATSDMIVQNGTLIVDGGDVNQEFLATLSPSVNATNSFFTYDGLNMDHSDLSWGSEEFGIMRVKNDTRWGYEPVDAPNSGNTEVRFSVIDWNNPNFIIQNGTGALLDGELLDTIVPSPAIDRRHTIILISTAIDSPLDAESDEYGPSATINSSNEIEIEREDADCVNPPSQNPCIVNYRYELITFPTTFANVTHDQIVKTSTTGSDVTVSTIDIFSPALGNVNNSIAIGTVHTPMGLGQARDSSGNTGSWDRNAYTIELINATAVNGTANDARNSANIPYQVIEFLQLGAVPDPPTNLGATPINSTTIDLSWTAPGGSITGYKIERQTPTGNPFEFISNKTTQATTHSDTTVAGNLNFTYRVSAFNQFGDGNPSNSVSAITEANVNRTAVNATGQTIEPNPTHNFTKNEIDTFISVIELFEPDTSILDLMIIDWRINKLPMFDTILKMDNYTYGTNLEFGNGTRVYGNEYVSLADLAQWFSTILNTTRIEIGLGQ